MPRRRPILSRTYTHLNAVRVVTLEDRQSDLVQSFVGYLIAGRGNWITVFKDYTVWDP